MNCISVIRTPVRLGISLLIAITSHACDKPITLMAGPFFTANTTSHYWSGFASEVASKTGCKLIIKASNNFEEYINDIANGKADILVAPEHYRKALKHNNFKAILKTKKDLNGYLVSRLDIKNNPKLLENQIVYTQGIFSRIHLEFEHWLISHNMLGKVELKLKNSHDAGIIYMLKNENASVIIVDVIYDQLPSKLKEKYHAVKIGNPAGVIIFTRSNLSNQIANAITAASDFITITKFEPIIVDQPSTGSDLELESRFYEIYQNLHPLNSSKQY